MPRCDCTYLRTAGAMKRRTAPAQVGASSTDVASAETKTALRIILHVDIIDISPDGVVQMTPDMC